MPKRGGDSIADSPLVSPEPALGMQVCVWAKGQKGAAFDLVNIFLTSNGSEMARARNEFCCQETGFAVKEGEFYF